MVRSAFKNLDSDKASASKSKISPNNVLKTFKNYPKFGRPQSTSVDLTQNPSLTIQNQGFQPSNPLQVKERIAAMLTM